MRGLGTLPLGYRSCVFLLAANIGAVITQAIMIVVIIAFAATIYTAGLHKPLGAVGQLAAALSSSIGPMNAKLLLGAAILGGAGGGAAGIAGRLVGRVRDARLAAQPQRAAEPPQRAAEDRGRVQLGRSRLASRFGHEGEV